MTAFYPDLDTINIWMDRDPIPIHTKTGGATNQRKLSGFGYFPDLHVTDRPGGRQGGVTRQENGRTRDAHAWIDQTTSL